MPNLKQELEQLLREFPTRLPGSNYNTAIEDCVDDIEAAFIKELNRLEKAVSLTPEQEHECDELFNDCLGATLFNGYTLLRHREPGQRLYFSSRKRVVRAMLRAMLEEEQAIADERALETLIASATV